MAVVPRRGRRGPRRRRDRRPAIHHRSLRLRPWILQAAGRGPGLVRRTVDYSDGELLAQHAVLLLGHLHRRRPASLLTTEPDEELDLDSDQRISKRHLDGLEAP